MLEKLVDSMTCKLFPATKIDFDPVLDRSGWIKIKKKTKIVRYPKNAEKPMIIIASTPKTSFFAIEMEDFRDQHGYRQASRAQPRLHPEKPQRIHPDEAPTYPLRGSPPRRDQKARGCN